MGEILRIKREKNEDNVISMKNMVRKENVNMENEYKDECCTDTDMDDINMMINNKYIYEQGECEDIEVRNG